VDPVRHRFQQVFKELPPTRDETIEALAKLG
jgi:hypothetical protein